jgi:nucleotide-binding universal stress UspA family protein
MNIVLGYDGSDEAKRALRVAIKHAKGFDGKIYVVTSLKGENKEGLINLKKDLENAVTFIKDLGIPCEGHLLDSNIEPGEEVVQFAKDNNADEIIIGIEKTSKVEKFIMGSNAQYVILNSPCTVVTVK